MRRRAASTLAGLGLALALAGCGTLYDAFAEGEMLSDGPHPFGGLTVDLFVAQQFLGEGLGETTLGLLALLDAPFSLALDLLLLPYTIPRALLAPERDRAELGAHGEHGHAPDPRPPPVLETAPTEPR